MTGWTRRPDGIWEYRGGEAPSFDEPTPLQKLVVRAIAISTIIVIPLALVFLVNRHQTNERVSDTKASIQRESELRRATTAANRRLTLHFNQVQEWADFDNCVADEQQDAVIVSLLRTIPKPRPNSVEDAIAALEPTYGDRVCVPPRGSRPAEARP